MIKKIGILGIAVSSGNRGVQALGSSLANLCSKENVSQAVLLAGHDVSGHMATRVNGGFQQIPIVNYRLSFKSGLKNQLFWIFLMSLLYRIMPIKFIRTTISNRIPWILAVEQCQIIGDVRGGDSFSDIYGMKRFVLGFLVAWSVILVKGSMVQFPQTYGPFKTSTARFMAKFLLRRSSMIIARDEKSRKVALDLLDGKQEVRLSPDVAFSLEVVVPRTIELEPNPGDKISPSEIIGVNVNGLMNNGGYDRRNMFGLKTNYPEFLQSVIERLQKESPKAEIWLVPHTYAPVGDVESDNEACKKVWDSLPNDIKTHVRIVTGEYNQHEIKGVIGQSNFFLGSRMHSCIAALSQGIPCVGLAYSMKFRGVFESVGMGDWVVDARSIDTDTAVESTLECYRKCKQVKADLKKSSEVARSRLNDVFTDLLNI